MKDFNEFLLDREQNLYEMANIGTNKTGLKEIIWVSVSNASHGPRIKIYKNKQPKGENFSVTIEESPRTIGDVFVDSKELNRIYEFIKTNKEALLDYWNYQLTTDELMDNILKI